MGRRSGPLALIEPIVVRETELDGFAEVDANDEDLTGRLRRRQRKRHLRCCGEVMHVDANRAEGALAFSRLGGRAKACARCAALLLLMMHRRAASLKAVASFPCQRIDVANGIRDSLGSPSVTVVAIGPS
jgi:hypothetical protein